MLPRKNLLWQLVEGELVGFPDCSRPESCKSTGEELPVLLRMHSKMGMAVYFSSAAFTSRSRCELSVVRSMLKCNSAS